MSEIKQLVTELAASAASHRSDIEHFEQLLRISKLAVGHEEIGKVLLALNDDPRNWEETKSYLHNLQERTNSIFRVWAMAARIEFLENRGAAK